MTLHGHLSVEALVSTADFFKAKTPINLAITLLDCNNRTAGRVKGPNKTGDAVWPFC